MVDLLGVEDQDPEPRRRAVAGHRALGGGEADLAGAVVPGEAGVGPAELGADLRGGLAPDHVALGDQGGVADVLVDDRGLAEDPELLAGPEEVPGDLGPGGLHQVVDLLAPRVGEDHQVVALLAEPPEDHRPVRRAALLIHGRQLEITRGGLVAVLVQVLFQPSPPGRFTHTRSPDTSASEWCNTTPYRVIVTYNSRGGKSNRETWIGFGRVARLHRF